MCGVKFRLCFFFFLLLLTAIQLAFKCPYCHKKTAIQYSQLLITFLSLLIIITHGIISHCCRSNIRNISRLLVTYLQQQKKKNSCNMMCASIYGLLHWTFQINCTTNRNATMLNVYPVEGFFSHLPGFLLLTGKLQSFVCEKSAQSLCIICAQNIYFCCYLTRQSVALFPVKKTKENKLKLLFYSISAFQFPD